MLTPEIRKKTMPPFLNEEFSIWPRSNFCYGSRHKMEKKCDTSHAFLGQFDTSIADCWNNAPRTSPTENTSTPLAFAPFFLAIHFWTKKWWNEIIVLHWRCSWKSGRLMALGGMIPRHKLYQHWARAQSHRRLVINVYSQGTSRQEIAIFWRAPDRKKDLEENHTPSTAPTVRLQDIFGVLVWSCARQVCIKSYKPLCRNSRKIPSGVQQKIQSL